MPEAMVVTVVRSLLSPERSNRVIVPWSVGVQEMVVEEPAVRVPPVGAVMGLDCAETRAAKAAMAVAKTEAKRMVAV